MYLELCMAKEAKRLIMASIKSQKVPCDRVNIKRIINEKTVSLAKKP